jgi:hypothetical protein
MKLERALDRRWTARILRAFPLVSIRCGSAMKTVEHELQRLIDAGFELNGCSEEEIRQIERSVWHRLPESYKMFLSIAGKADGRVLGGAFFEFPMLLRFRPSALKVIEASKSDFVLRPEHFVFALHDQGYSFLFFSLKDLPNPPIFCFHDQDSQPRQVCSEFLDWVAVCVEEELDDL